MSVSFATFAISNLNGHICLRAALVYFREVIISSLVGFQLLLITNAKLHLIRAGYKRPVAILTSFQSKKRQLENQAAHYQENILITDKQIHLNAKISLNSCKSASVTLFQCTNHQFYISF